MADQRQPEITRSIRSWGFYTLKPTDAYQTGWAQKRPTQLIVPTEGGRFDMFVMGNGRVAAVEVKNDELAFAFAQFQQNKRDWLKLMEPFQISSWLCLLLGNMSPAYNKEVHPTSRRAWLMPIEHYFAVEELISPIQNSIPMIAGKGYNKTLQENHWDAVNLFSDYELTWGKGSWELPSGHLFRTVFNVEVREAA